MVWAPPAWRARTPPPHAGAQSPLGIHSPRELPSGWPSGPPGSMHCSGGWEEPPGALLAGSREQGPGQVGEKCPGWPSGSPAVWLRPPFWPT